MYDVYIINDSESERKHLQKLFVRYQIVHNVEMAVNGLPYLAFDTFANKVSFFLLDASNSQVKKTVEQIRNANINHIIVLVLESMAQIMNVMTPTTLPSAFLFKPVHYDELEEQLALLEYAVTNRLKNDTEAFTWTIKARTISVPISSILYFESRNKKTFLITEAKEYELNKTIDTLEKELSVGFIRTHRSYLVNQKHVREYDFGSMLLWLDDNTQVLISRSGKENIKRVIG